MNKKIEYGAAALLVAIGLLWMRNCGGDVRSAPTTTTRASRTSTTETVTTTTKSPEQYLQEALDYEASHYSSPDAAFLKDLHSVWKNNVPEPADSNSPFPGYYVEQAHAVCALREGTTKGALDDVIHMLRPDLVGSVYTIALGHPGVITLGEKFITVTVQHFCPDRANEPFWNGA